MKSFIALLALVSLAAPFIVGPTSVEAANCRFVLGFKAIHDQIPDIVGECLNNERYDGNGATQNTARGMMAWRKSDNFTAFTDGYRTWVNGPYGIQQRLNTERFSWENDPSNQPQPVVPAPTAPLTIQTIDGRATVVARDGTYIGKLSSNSFDSESICNEFGRYGSQFSSLSIRNEFSHYGSEFASYSAYNSMTSTPPMIIYGGAVIGYLTKNRMVSGGVDPDVVIAIYGCTNR